MRKKATSLSQNGRLLSIPTLPPYVRTSFATHALLRSAYRQQSFWLKCHPLPPTTNPFAFAGAQAGHAKISGLNGPEKKIATLNGVTKQHRRTAN